MSKSPHMTRELNGAQLAILANRFEGIARKMANTLLRTGRSGVLNRARDFSCCLVTADCELLASAESLPIHVLSGPDLMARTMIENHPTLRRGDAFLHNSPYHGCSHAADHTILVPVIDAQGVHRFTVLAKAHQADIGNSIPTTYHGAARDVYEEGALIFPAVKIQSDYADVSDIIRMCELRIRVPEQWYGDYLSTMGAARIGERELLALGEEVGWDHLEAFSRQWLDYSERRMEQALRAMPNGAATVVSTHDAMPGTPETGVAIRSTVTIDPAAASISVDLRENADCLPCGLNLSEACARTAAMIGVFNSIDPSVPKNAGSFRRVTVLLREGCVVGIPKHPTSCSVATTNIADRVANATQCAIAEIADGFGMAECGAAIAPSAGVISGIDPNTNEPYVNQIFLAFTAGAASAWNDCWLTVGHVGNAGCCHLDSVEIDELAHPILVYERSIVPDSEGAGRHRGAPSSYVEFGPDGCSFEIGYVSDGSSNPARGARGGKEALGASQYRRKIDDNLEPLPACAQVTIHSGERVLATSCGGGGYGSPLERDPERVRKDVAEGWISRDRAEAIYGVVINEGGEIAEAATRARRVKGMS